MSEPEATFEIEGPSAECNDCRFTVALSGTWSVEDGRLVWRGDADLQPGRGPDLFFCCESDKFIDFTKVTVEGPSPQWEKRTLTSEEFDALRASARPAT